jgi:hypothetical protein
MKKKTKLQNQEARFWKFLAAWLLACVGWLLVTFIMLDILAARAVP